MERWRNEGLVVGERILVSAEACVWRCAESREARYGRCFWRDCHCGVDSRSLMCEGGMWVAESRDVSRRMSSMSSEGSGCGAGLGCVFEGLIVDGVESSRLCKELRRNCDVTERSWAAFSVYQRVSKCLIFSISG